VFQLPPTARVSRQAGGLRRHGRLATAVLVCALACAFGAQSACRSRSALPAQLTDEEFWKLMIDLSEPAGDFPHSDNLVSNETQSVQTMQSLGSLGGVYIGVGPEQNFSFIARLQPAMAFIVDIRAGNRGLHLLYKALFESAGDRAAFVSRLFSRRRPDGLGPEASAEELFAAFARQPADLQLREETLQLVRARLMEQHEFALTADDLASIEYALTAFFLDGPDIHYARLHPSEPKGPSYRTLMTVTAVGGAGHSFLWSEEKFAFVKQMQARNLIVPVIADFGGTGGLRRTGEYVRQRRGVVTAFYSSNVEVYLNREKLAVFCRSLSMLPYNWQTWFIGSKGKQPLRLKLAACTGQDTLKLPPR
jgi:hypothetical protein